MTHGYSSMTVTPVMNETSIRMSSGSAVIVSHLAPYATRSSPPHWTQVCPCGMSRKRLARRPRTTMSDRARDSQDRHATYVVSMFIVGASR
jgi:hypothetical protein